MIVGMTITAFHWGTPHFGSCMRLSRQYRLSVLLGLGLLAGCGDVGSSPRSPTLDKAQAQFIGGLVAAQLSDLIGDLTAADSLQGGFSAFLRQNSSVSRIAPLIAQARQLGSKYRFVLPSLAFPCDPEGTNAEDSDGDGIATDDTLTFTPANCGGEDRESGLVTSVSGTVRVQDIGAIYGFQLTLSDFEVSIVPRGQRLGTTIVLNGTYRANVNASGASALQDLDYDIQLAGAPPISVSYNWDAEFTPMEGMRISPNRRWPNGTFDITGNLDYSVGDNQMSFSLDTTDPLIYEPGCETPPPFSSGELQGVLTTNQSSGFTLTHRHCGAAPAVSAVRGGV